MQIINILGGGVQEFSEMGGLPKMGGLFLKWGGGLNPSTNYDSTWFLNNTVNVKLSERSNPIRIVHIIDIEKPFGIDNLDDFISNTSITLVILFLNITL